MGCDILWEFNSLLLNMGHRIIEIVDLPIKNGWTFPVRYVIYVSLPEGSSTPERIIWRITPRLLLENPVETSVTIDPADQIQSIQSAKFLSINT